MTNSTLAGIVLLVLAPALTGCDGARPSPTSPTPPSIPTTVSPAAPVPNGAVVARGTVFDTAFRALAGATVEALDDPQAGTSTITGPTGYIPANMVFDLALGGAKILENPSIGVAGDVVGFRLYDDGYPYIVEHVATNVFVGMQVTRR